MNKIRQSSAMQSKSLWLTILGVLSCLLYEGIIWKTLPIPVMLSFFTAAFIVYLISIFIAVRAKQQSLIVATIWGFAIAFRFLLLFSEPILEIDIYRYLWDGRVVTAGISPFQYSPQQVLEANQNEEHPADLQKLIAIREASPSIKHILSKIHFEEYTTIYPPVSQAVFAVSQFATPLNASVKTHLTVMKFFLVLFDLLTIFLLIKILQLTSLPAGWVIAYAWSPLVLKEIANSGHLDSITICLTTAAIYFVVKLFSPTSSSSSNKKEILNHPVTTVCFASVLFALAVGAKLYPLVLFPLIGMAIWKRVSLWSASLFALLFFAIVTPICWQMMLSQKLTKEKVVTKTSQVVSQSVTQNVYEEVLPPIPPGADDFSPPQSTSPQQQDKLPLKESKPGLKGFLKTWEMNDLFFMLISENMKPENGFYVWFAPSLPGVRQKWVEQLAPILHVQPQRVPFVFARLVTTIIFLIIVMFQTLPKNKTATAENFLQAVFLTLAWFWLLLPTQNPWYWIWAMPFLPFAKNRVWLILSGLVIVNYLRFWLNDYYGNQVIWGTGYQGESFYDYVVVWIEYVPWLLLLIIQSVRLYKQKP